MKKIIIIFIYFFLAACNKGNLDSSSTSSSGSDPNSISCKGAGSGGNISLSNPPSGVNVLPVTLNGSYTNAPMVSVKICEVGSAVNCTTVSNILVDTGSYGLRVFKSTINSLNLTQINAQSGNPLAECAQFGIGSTWGPVQSADIVLATESPVTVPIQIIDSTFSGTGKPSVCSNADTDPASAGYNGILGVGLFQEDCGSGCVTSVSSQYYSCSGTNCSQSKALLNTQVVNPVARLTTDNNGVILQLPSIANCGAQTVNGVLILGVNTGKANNAVLANSVTIFPTNSVGELTTTFNGTNYTQSFIDSGSNGLFFPRTSSLPSCTQTYQGQDISAFNCPYDTVNLTATLKSGGITKSVPFVINNAYNLFSSNNYNFVDMSANWSGAFDWGLPFFFGRKVYVGINGQTSTTLGTGPYIAY